MHPQLNLHKKYSHFSIKCTADNQKPIIFRRSRTASNTPSKVKRSICHPLFDQHHSNWLIGRFERQSTTLNATRNRMEVEELRKIGCKKWRAMLTADFIASDANIRRFYYDVSYGVGMWGLWGVKVWVFIGSKFEKCSMENCDDFYTQCELFAKICQIICAITKWQFIIIIWHLWHAQSQHWINQNLKTQTATPFVFPKSAISPLNFHKFSKTSTFRIKISSDFTTRPWCILNFANDMSNLRVVNLVGETLIPREHFVWIIKRNRLHFGACNHSVNSKNAHVYRNNGDYAQFNSHRRIFWLKKSMFKFTMWAHYEHDFFRVEWIKKASGLDLLKFRSTLVTRD